MQTLDELGLKHETDKASNHHDYLKVYEQYLFPLRNERFNMVEIGIGGYEYEMRGGQSLRMWNEYFPHARIAGIDIFRKGFFISDRVSLHCEEKPEPVIKALQPLVIIDDGSHINAETIENFNTCFQHLQPGGLYFIEDVHCSYWKDHFYGDPDPESKLTTMGFFTRLVHQLNHHVLLDQYKNEYAGKIEFVHFYKELIVVKKAA